MKVIDINYIKDKYIYYRPLFINGDYIYIVKDDLDIDYDEIEKTKEYAIFDGIYRYHIPSGLLEKIETSDWITDYYFGANKLYYFSIKVVCNRYIATFYEIENNLEKKKAEIELDDYVEGYSIAKIRTQLQPIVLKDGFISYLYDVNPLMNINQYTSDNDENELKLFIYDANEGKNYENQDKEFCKHTFDNMIPFKHNNEEYLLFGSSLYNEFDKEEYIYDPSREDINNYRGAKDSIYIIPIETFINDIKQGKQHISYKTIDTIGQEGTLKFIRLYGLKIYYNIIHFDEDYSELAIYDISNNQYFKKRYESCYRFRKMTYDCKYAYFYDDKNSCYVEFSGDFFEKRRKVEVEGWIKGDIESKFIITDGYSVINGKGTECCKIYDKNTFNLLKRFEGKPEVFEKEDIVVVY